ncbi:MAG TPA: GNAT family N-acetyltransferase [Kofleriaceae bacterium]|jgi:ribosomal protein S18 acetylase RimI-like enzyme
MARKRTRAPEAGEAAGKAAPGKAASGKAASGKAAAGKAASGKTASGKTAPARRAKKQPPETLITVRHMARRDINRVWDFLKISFREVNAETVEYQRPRSKHRFEEIYEEEGIEQLVFELEGQIVAYAECSYEVTGSDNWINPRYFEKREMEPLFVDELAVHPEMHGRGVGSFVLEQLHHLARVHGLNHLVLEVAENNESALNWYKKRDFKKLDAAIFMACAVENEPELLPPRALPPSRTAEADAESSDDDSRGS